MSIGSEERAAVLRVLDRGVLSQYKGNWSEDFYGGSEIQALEKEWAEYFNVKHAIACNSATSGLWMACSAIGLQQNYNSINDKCNVKAISEGPFSPPYYIQEYNADEIIVSPYSMTCSASVPLHFGAKPVFADIEEDYYCLDVKSIEERITERTRAIIVVDLFGQPYNADEINALAKRKGEEYGHKIYVIEDASQAAGAKYKGKYAGTLGDIGVFSLNVHKPIQCGEGGIVVTDNDELAFKLRLTMNHSEAVLNDMSMKTIADLGVCRISELEARWPFGVREHYLSLIGMNLRMTELSAAIAREQLKKLAGIVKTQQEYADLYFGCNGSVKTRPDCEHAFYRYAGIGPIKLNLAFTQDLLEKIMHIKKHYIAPLYKMPLFKSLGYDQHCCPVCEKVDENIVLAWLKEVI